MSNLERAAVLEAHLVFGGKENDAYVLLKMEASKEMVLKHIITDTPEEAIQYLNDVLKTGDFAEWHNDDIDQVNGPQQAMPSDAEHHQKH